MNDRSQSASALEIRAGLNNTRGTLDLAGLLRDELELRPESRLLDIGCGTGALLLSYAAALRPPGECVAIDASEESLATLRMRLQSTPLPIRPVLLDMDALVPASAHSHLGTFTHVTAAYSLYYSADPVRLLAGVAARMCPEGRMIVAAPAAGNNAEWFSLLDEAEAPIPRWIRDLDRDFVANVLGPAARSRFQSVRTISAINRVTFRSASELTAYWRSNIYFSAEASPRVERAIERHFSHHDTFGITKRVAVSRMEHPR